MKTEIKANRWIKKAEKWAMQTHHCTGYAYELEGLDVWNTQGYMEGYHEDGIEYNFESFEDMLVAGLFVTEDGDYLELGWIDLDKDTKEEVFKIIHAREYADLIQYAKELEAAEEDEE